MAKGQIIERTELRDRLRVFRDRAHAGASIARLLAQHDARVDCVLAIPAGGIPVAIPVAKSLGVPLDFAVVSKMTLPWNTEVGFGALAFDGTMRLNEPMLASVQLSQREIRAGVASTKAKIARREHELRGRRGPLDLRGRTVVVVDDGLASGVTMRAAVGAVRNRGCHQVLVAVPTAHVNSAREIAELGVVVFCPNLRSGTSFAVADAYEYWSDVDDEEVAQSLRAAGMVTGLKSG